MFSLTRVALMLTVAATLCACSGTNNNAGNSAPTRPSGGRVAQTPPPPQPGRGFPSQGNAHINPGDAHIAYNSDPPTSGPHFPTVPRRGTYKEPLLTEYLPHFLEHGGVEALYNASAPPDVVKALTDLINQELDRPPGNVLLAPRPEMPCQVTVSAWTRLLAFGAPDCQPGASGRPLAVGSADMTLVRQFIERNECAYDPENICGAGVKGEATFPTPAPGQPTVIAPGAPTAAAAAAPAGSPGARGPFSAAPTLTIDPGATYIATIKTAKGEIALQLDAKAAPITVNNFVFLANQHFYDGLTCHRVIPGFVAQCGDPTGTGGGGPGYAIPDEASPLKHDTGVIAMAKSSAPNSAGSQFYITLAPQPALDGRYTVFGKVTQGMDVVQQLRPRDPSANQPPGDQIISITMTKQ